MALEWFHQLRQITGRIGFFSADTDFSAFGGGFTSHVVESARQVVIQVCKKPEIDIAPWTIGMMKTVHLSIGEQVLKPASVYIRVAVLPQQCDRRQEGQGECDVKRDA